MAIKTINDANLTAIADAIRAKGVEGTFKPSEMATAIAGISRGEYVSTEIEEIVKQFTIYAEIVKIKYAYSNYTGKATYTFYTPTDKEYRLVLALKTYAGQYTRANVVVDGSTSKNYEGNSNLNLFEQIIPIGTSEIIVTGTCPQYETSSVRCFLLEDLTTSYSTVEEVIAALPIYTTDPPFDLAVKTDYSSYMSVEKKENVITYPNNILITPGYAIINNEKVLEFKGVIYNEAN